MVFSAPAQKEGEVRGAYVALLNANHIGFPVVLKDVPEFSPGFLRVLADEFTSVPRGGSNRPRSPLSLSSLAYVEELPPRRLDGDDELCGTGSSARKGGTAG